MNKDKIFSKMEDRNEKDNANEGCGRFDSQKSVKLEQDSRN